MQDLLIDRRTQQMVEECMPTHTMLRKIAAYFTALSDETRIKLITALSVSSMCVSDLCTLLNLNQTTVSHQLRLLRGIGAVDYRKQGKISFYYLSDQNLAEMMLNAVNTI